MSEVLLCRGISNIAHERSSGITCSYQEHLSMSLLPSLQGHLEQHTSKVSISGARSNVHTSAHVDAGNPRDRLDPNIPRTHRRCKVVSYDGLSHPHVAWFRLWGLNYGG